MSTVSGDTKQPWLILSNGSRMPAIAFGSRGSLPTGTVYTSVKAALAEGYRHIGMAHPDTIDLSSAQHCQDTASAYGCEAEVGQAIRESGVPRNEIWVTTKLDNQQHHNVSEAAQLSLTALGLEYIDLYLMHWPCPLDPEDQNKLLLDWHFSKTWAAMQELSKEIVRNIGVANFDIHNLKVLMAAETTRVLPCVNQVEIHPYRPASDLLRFCRLHNIQCLAYSPFGSRNSPIPHDPIVCEVARSSRKTAQQVLLKWALQRGHGVVPGSTQPRNVISNFDVHDWTLGQDEMIRISSIHQRMQVYNDTQKMKFPIRIFHDEG